MALNLDWEQRGENNFYKKPLDLKDPEELVRLSKAEKEMFR
jgi:hypothetical protein